MLRCFALLTAAALLFASGCGSCGSDDKKEDADEANKTQRKKLRDPDEPKPKERPKACVKAEACCADMAEARGQDPDLVCSGVKLAETGDKCEEFHEGYAGVFEASGMEMPESCIK